MGRSSYGLAAAVMLLSSFAACGNPEAQRTPPTAPPSTATAGVLRSPSSTSTSTTAAPAPTAPLPYSTTTTVPSLPPRTVISAPTPPPLEDVTIPSVNNVDLTELTNPNQPLTVLSTLCWARNEIVLAALWVLQQQIEGRGTLGSYRRHMMQAVNDVRDDVERLELVALTPPVHSFARAFQEDLAAATVANVLPSEMTLFDFEHYPGARAYVAAARTEDSCATP